MTTKQSRPFVRRAAAAPAPAPESETPATDTPDLPPDSLQAVMAELGGSTSSFITIYRAERGQPQAYVYKCSPDEFSLDVLRDKYNGGTFRLYISRNGVLWRNITVSVEPKHSADPTPPSDMAALAASMREGFAKQAEAMAAALRSIAAPPPPPPPSPFAGINIVEAVTAISTLLQVLRPPAAPRSEDSVTLLIKGMELAKEMRENAGGDGEVSFLSLAKELIKSPLLAQAVTAAQAAPAVPAVSHAKPRPPQPTAPTMQAPTPAHAAPQPATQDIMQLTPYLGMLCQKAAEGSDPSLYADLILDSLPFETIEQLASLQPDPYTALVAIHPPMAAHQEWFQQLITLVIQTAGGADEGLDDAGAVVPQSVDTSTIQPHAAGTTPPTVPARDSVG